MSFFSMGLWVASSRSVLGVWVVLHAAYSDAAAMAEIDLPLTRPLSSAFL